MHAVYNHKNVGNSQEIRRKYQRVSLWNQRLNDANMFRLGLDGRTYEFLGVLPVAGDQDAAVVVFAIKSTLDSLLTGANVLGSPEGTVLGGRTGFGFDGGGGFGFDGIAGFGFDGGLCLGSRGPMSSSRPRRSALGCFVEKRACDTGALCGRAGSFGGSDSSGVSGSGWKPGARDRFGGRWLRPSCLRKARRRGARRALW